MTEDETDGGYSASALGYGIHTQQPVVKVPAAFERRCIPPDGVVRRLRMPNMRPPHALSGGHLAALGATRGSTTGCQGDSLDDTRLHVREVVDCYFDDSTPRPKLIRLHFVREEVLAA